MDKTESGDGSLHGRFDGGLTDIDVLMSMLVLHIERQLGLPEMKVSTSDVLRVAQYLKERRGSTERELIVRWEDNIVRDDVN